MDHLNNEWESDPSSITWDHGSLNAVSMETTQWMNGMYGTLEYQYLFQDIYFTAKKDSLPGTQGSSLSITVVENAGSDMASDDGGSNISIELAGNASSYNTDQIMTLLANGGLSSFVVAGGSTDTDFDASASPVVFREGKELKYQSTTVNCSLTKEW